MEIEKLLDKVDLAKNAKISRITIDDFELKAEMELQGTGINTDKIKRLLMARKKEILHDIENSKNTFPKKPKSYAFLEKRLHLTPLQV